jgi:hypothetical protein
MVFNETRKQSYLCQTGGSQSGVPEDLCLQGFYTMLIGKQLPQYIMIIVLLSAGMSSERRV